MCVAPLVLGGCLYVREGAKAVAQGDSHVTRADRVDATPERVSTLRVPAGLAVTPFARDLAGARMMAVTADGAVLVTRPGEGDVYALHDADGDGRAERRDRVLSKLDGVHGIAVHEGKVYLSTPTQLLVSDVGAGGALGQPRVIARLPEGGQHSKRTQAVGPDGRLYVSIGSTCNACVESDSEHATLLRFGLDGSGRELFARGLRNTMGFAWHPETKVLWGMDHGSDHRGDDVPPEELNRLEQGKDYGWPWAYGERVVDAEMEEPPSGSKAERARASEPMVLGYQAHSAPMGMIFLHRALGPLRRGDAVVAMHGSWNRDRSVGYEVVSIRFEDGKPKAFEPLVSGFLMADGKQFGRPTGLAQLADGSVLVSDDENGIVYRISEAERPR
jgi:glucose/arabinose dehydrogenase